MSENGSGKGGKLGKILGWILAFVVVFLLYAWRRQRTVRNLLGVFQESPVKAILILVIAIALAIGITVIRNYFRNRKK
ncbi:hypothetical protein [Ruminococcus sp.]